MRVYNYYNKKRNSRDATALDYNEVCIHESTSHILLAVTTEIIKYFSQLCKRSPTNTEYFCRPILLVRWPRLLSLEAGHALKSPRAAGAA